MLANGNANSRPRPNAQPVQKCKRATAGLVRLHLTCKTRPAALQNGAAWTSAAPGQPSHRRSWACDKRAGSHELAKARCYLLGQQPRGTASQTMSQLAGYAGRAVTLADLEPRSTSAPLGERRPTVIEPAAIPSALLTYDGQRRKPSDAYGKCAATIFPDVDPKSSGTSPAALAQEEEEGEAAGPDSINDRQRRERKRQCAGAGKALSAQVRGRHEQRRPAGRAGQEYR